MNIRTLLSGTSSHAQFFCVHETGTMEGIRISFKADSQLPNQSDNLPRTKAWTTESLIAIDAPLHAPRASNTLTTLYHQLLRPRTRRQSRRSSKTCSCLSRPPSSPFTLVRVCLHESPVVLSSRTSGSVRPDSAATATKRRQRL